MFPSTTLGLFPLTNVSFMEYNVSVPRYEFCGRQRLLLSIQADHKNIQVSLPIWQIQSNEFDRLKSKSEVIVSRDECMGWGDYLQGTFIHLLADPSTCIISHPKYREWTMVVGSPLKLNVSLSSQTPFTIKNVCWANSALFQVQIPDLYRSFSLMDSTSFSFSHCMDMVAQHKSTKTKLHWLDIAANLKLTNQQRWELAEECIEAKQWLRSQCLLDQYWRLVHDVSYSYTLSTEYAALLYLSFVCHKQGKEKDASIYFDLFLRCHANINLKRTLSKLHWMVLDYHEKTLKEYQEKQINSMEDVEEQKTIVKPNNDLFSSIRQPSFPEQSKETYWTYSHEAILAIQQDVSMEDISNELETCDPPLSQLILPTKTRQAIHRFLYADYASQTQQEARSYSFVEKRPLPTSEGRGQYGLFATTHINKGCLLLPIRVLAVTEDEYYYRLCNNYNRVQYEPYIIELTSRNSNTPNLLGMMTEQHGNDSRYINDFRIFSSEGPFADIERYGWKGVEAQQEVNRHRINCDVLSIRRIDSNVFMIFLYNSRPIARGQELFFDYGKDYWMGLLQASKEHKATVQLMNDTVQAFHSSLNLPVVPCLSM